MSNPGRQRPSGLQRRGLQLPGAARRARGARARVLDLVRQRGRASRLRGMGAVLLPALQRHVVARHLGRATCGRTRVVLCRDHLGIKPMYLAEAGGRLLFASEIKALLACSRARSRSVDEQRLAEYLLRGLHDHDERTFFGRRAPDAAGDGDGHLPRRTASASGASATGRPSLSGRRRADPAVFRAAFRRAVERRLVADVTVGTCLSGGLDSSSIVSVMSDLLAAGAPDAASHGRPPEDVLGGVRRRPHRRAALHRAQCWTRPGPRATSSGLSRTSCSTTCRSWSGTRTSRWSRRARTPSTGSCSSPRARPRCSSTGRAATSCSPGYVPYQYVYLRELPARDRPACGCAAHEALPHATSSARSYASGSPTGARRSTRGRSARAPAGSGPARMQATARRPPRVRDDLKTRLLQDLTDLQPSVAPALRGPQLDGALDRVAAAVFGSGTRRARAGASVRRHRPGRVESLDPPRIARRRPARASAHPAQEDRLHHAAR